MIVDEKALKKYLLGNAGDKVTETIDLRIIGEPQFEQELAAAEESLIEEYLDKSLDEDEIRLFHSNFAVSEERLSHISLIDGLRRIAKEKRSEVPVAHVDGSTFIGTLTANVRELFAARPAVLVSASIGLIILLGLFGWTSLMRNDVSPNRLEAEYAGLNREDLSSREKTRGSGRIDLIAGTSRSANTTADRIKKKDFDRYLFVLDVSSIANANAKYRIGIEKNESEIFSQTHLRVYDNKIGGELRVLIPVSVLKSGEHRIKVVSEDLDAEPNYYYFEVE